MKTYPKISIITPSYNQALYLEATICSVLEQGYPNLEYIVIDGGSTDDSLEIIKRYAKYLTYWISEKDNGQYHAINKGFAKSSGEIMAWLNSDDMYHRNALFSVAEIFDNFAEISWLQGANTQFDETGRCVRAFSSRDWSKYNFYLGNFKWIQQESTFWRRTLWEKAGGYVDDSLHMAGDYELWLRFFRYSKLYVTDALIGGFRFRGSEQKSLDLDKYYQEVDLVLNREIETLPIEVINRIDLIKDFQEKLRSSSLRKEQFDLENKKLAKLFEYPPKLYFDRFSQRFTFDNG